MEHTFIAEMDCSQLHYAFTIGLASNLASPVSIANPIHCANVRFPPTGFCDFHKNGQLLHASGVRPLDRID